MDYIDDKELREQLTNLGAPRLAHALVYISSHTKGGTEYIEALLLTPEEVYGRKCSS